MKKSAKIAMFVTTAIIAAIGIMVAVAPPSDRPSTERVNITPEKAYFAAQELIRAKLPNPSASSFPTLYDRFDKVNETTYWIEGHADSPGYIRDRVNYQIKVKYNSGDWTQPTSWEMLEFRII